MQKIAKAQSQAGLEYWQSYVGLVRAAHGVCPETASILGAMAYTPIDRYGTSFVPLQRLLFGALNQAQVPSWSAEMASYFLTWRNQKLPAQSTTALCDVVTLAITHTGLTWSDVHVRAAYVAAHLGSIHQPHAFHNHFHTLEVVCLTLRLITMQMNMGASFTPHEILECVIAACIHDFAHCGQSDGIAPMHMEARALQHALPFLTLAGLGDDVLARVRVMVLTTDVSKSDKATLSPAKWLRRAYAHHNNSPLDPTAWQTCPEVLHPLFHDARLCMQAMLVEEADLGASAAMPYDFAKLMTKLLAQENPAIASRPETLIKFLTVICGDSFVTEAGQMLMNQNAKLLVMDAQQDLQSVLYSWS